ncbi:MAG: hypothetical protein J6V53_04620 [Alphaproteobacteria bacterium]|nr:hypothetical protein [Alphaproteobacteria bacterium]
MKKNLFLFCAFTCLFSCSLLAQTKNDLSDEPFVIYRVDEQKVSAESLKEITDGKLEAFHNREKVSALLKNGFLTGAFSSTGFDGTFSGENSFSVQDRSGNFARGEVICSGMDTFKSFVGYLVSPTDNMREDLYKCLSFSKASYLSADGPYFLEGGVSFPIVTQPTTISFMPQKGVMPVVYDMPEVKNIQFGLNEDVHKIDVMYHFQDDKKVTFSYDFTESYLPKLLGSPFHFLKEAIWNAKGEEFVLKSFSLPSLIKGNGLSFKGELHSQKGFIGSSQLAVFSGEEKKVAEISYLNNSLFIDLKYPGLLTPFIEGEFKNMNSSKMFSSMSDFISNLLKNPNRLLTQSEKASLLSGLEVKGLTVYDDKHEKKALFNLKFEEEITPSMIKKALKDPKLMDLWVFGEVILFVSPHKEMKISFNKSDEVRVNGNGNNGKKEADLYGILKYLQQQMKPSIKRYVNEMQAVFDQIYILGPVVKKFRSKLQVKNIMNAARKVASKNYNYCISELEKERIDFMYDCKGIQPSLLKGVEMPDDVDISLPDETLYPLILNDKKTGRDLVYLTFKFKDKESCEYFAKEKTGSCLNNEITTGVLPEMSSY